RRSRRRTSSASWPPTRRRPPPGPRLRRRRRLSRALRSSRNQPVYRRVAALPELAALASGAAPERVVEPLHLVEELGVVGDDAELEVAPALALGAQARAGPVGAAEVEERAVDDDGLEVDARAEPQRRAEARVAGPLSREGTRGHAGVEDPHVDAASGELVE